MTTLDPRSGAQPSQPNTFAPILLLAVNAIPLVGVLLFEWRLFDLMLLYWLENGVIGVFTVLKILASKGKKAGERVLGPAERTATKVFTALFFAFHYGVFWVVHGVFVFMIFGGTFVGLPIGSGFAPSGLGAAPSAAAGTVALALASLVVSHGASYVTNYLGRGEDRALTPRELMAQPYARVTVLHLTIIGGGFLAMMLGSPIAALLLLVALKTGVDLSAHLREHRAAAAS